MAFRFKSELKMNRLYDFTDVFTSNKNPKRAKSYLNFTRPAGKNTSSLKSALSAPKLPEGLFAKNCSGCVVGDISDLRKIVWAS